MVSRAPALLYPVHAQCAGILTISWIIRHYLWLLTLHRFHLGLRQLKRTVRHTDAESQFSFQRSAVFRVARTHSHAHNTRAHTHTRNAAASEHVQVDGRWLIHSSLAHLMAGALDGALGHPGEERNALVSEVLQVVGAMLGVFAKNIVESCCAQGPGTQANNVNTQSATNRK